jgi:hypothetical protein
MKQATARASANWRRVYAMPVASVYPSYIAKAEKKGRTRAEVDDIFRWLTGHSQASLEAVNGRSVPQLRLRQHLRSRVGAEHPQTHRAIAEGRQAFEGTRRNRERFLGLTDAARLPSRC